MISKDRISYIIISIGTTFLTTLSKMVRTSPPIMRTAGHQFDSGVFGVAALAHDIVLAVVGTRETQHDAL